MLRIFHRQVDRRRQAIIRRRIRQEPPCGIGAAVPSYLDGRASRRPLPARLDRVLLVVLNLAITVAVLSLVGPYNEWPFELRSDGDTPVLAVGTGRTPRLVTGPLAEAAAAIAERSGGGIAWIDGLRDVPEANAMADLSLEVQVGMAEFAQGFRQDPPELPSFPAAVGSSLRELAQAIGDHAAAFGSELDRWLGWHEPE